MRQEPKHSRICGFVDRRPIDPPPIIQLRLVDDKELDPMTYNPYFFVYACLTDENGQEVLFLSDMATRSTTGSIVSSIFRLKDENQQNEVYSAKKFPGMEESSLLSRLFADQGVKMRLRKELRQRKPGGSGKRFNAGVYDSEDEDPVPEKRRRYGSESSGGNSDDDERIEKPKVRVHSPLALLAETIESSNASSETHVRPNFATYTQSGEKQRVPNRLEDLANSSIRPLPPPNFQHVPPWSYPYYHPMPFHPMSRPPPDLHHRPGTADKKNDWPETPCYIPPVFPPPFLPYDSEKRRYPETDDNNADRNEATVDRPPMIDLPRPPPVPPFYHPSPYHHQYAYEMYSRQYYDPYQTYSRGYPVEESRFKSEEDQRTEDQYPKDLEPVDDEKDQSQSRYDMGRYYYPPPPHYYSPYPNRAPFYPPYPPRPPPK